MYYNVRVRSLRTTTVAVEKQYGFSYSECVFVALCIQRAKGMRHIFICTLPGTTTFFHIIS